MAARENIYYWKCDRPSAFFAIEEGNGGDKDGVDRDVVKLLADYFGSTDFTVGPGAGQGNHLTYLAAHKGERFFVRIENGPEKDDYMEVEAAVINRARQGGIPTPRIYAVDSSRRKYPFAYQIMENVEYPDLNRTYKEGALRTEPVMRQIGAYIARWQEIGADGYGPFNSDTLRATGRLEGLLPSYPDYYKLNLGRHLDFLVSSDFLPETVAAEILDLVRTNGRHLDIGRGCLVHKDIALWNVLGTPDTVKSVIDWDDSVSGDPTDDLSLMACFHSAEELAPLIAGYESVRPLPADFEPRFWLHLLRNMLFKAVIRVGAGYFKKDGNFFLINSAGNGGNGLYDFTLGRIRAACDGLKGNKNIDEL